MRKSFVYIKPVLYIYGLVKTSTSELVYVGQTLRPENRFNTHRSSTVKDIKDDCHMVIFDFGTDKTTLDEHFWIEYMMFIGCNLRNKRVKTAHGYTPSIRYASDNHVMPHLTQDMNRAGISPWQMARTARIHLSTVIRLRNGGGASYREAFRVSKVLQLGTAIFEGLSDYRAENLLLGRTTASDVRRYQKRIESKSKGNAQVLDFKL